MGIVAYVVVMVSLGACGRLGFDVAAHQVHDDGGPGDGRGAVDSAVMLVIPPIASWTFDGTDQAVSDSAGMWNGVLGTSAAVESSDPQRITTAARICSGAGLQFDGGDDVVTFPSPSAASLSVFSISFSLHATGAGSSSLPRILTKEDGGASDVIVHYRVADDAIAINIFNTANALFATFADGVVVNERASWVVTYDDTSDRRLHVYKNGIETTYRRQDAVTGTLRTTTNAWQIGNQVTGVRGFEGTIDDMRVYDVVLPPTEIAALAAVCP